MIRNLVLTALRSLRKNKFFSILNILGLSIGTAVFLLIAQYVTFENSYENFIPGAGNIYRVGLSSYVNNELVVNSAENYPGVAGAFKAELPEVTSTARLYNLGYKNNVIITYDDARPDPIAFKHRRFLYADSSFLAMMNYSMLTGDPRTALSEPSTAVISEKYARMYFGKDDPLGKILHMRDDDGNNELVRVTGVFRDIPLNSHLKFDVLFSYKTLFSRFEKARDRYDHSWRRADMYTFVAVRPGTNIDLLQSKFSDIIAKYSPSLKERNQRDVLFLQPLKSIHLASNLAEEAEPNGDTRIVTFLALIGLFVLVIAWINYVNLSTAKALERAREVGIRKVMGAFRNQLVTQFLAEAAVVNFIAIAISQLIILVALTPFNSVSGLSLTPVDLLESWYLLVLAGLWLAGTLMSGFYPALVLSSFKPVVVLKGKLKNSLSGVILRKSLVVVQFMASVALIAGTLIVYRQLRHMMSRDLGVDINQVMVLDRPGLSQRSDSTLHYAIDVFRTELKRNPSVKGVSASITIPGKQREYKEEVKRYGASDDQLVSVRINSMDYDFMDVFKMKLLAGRVFSPDFQKDVDTSSVITLSAARLLGFKYPEDAIGQTITIPQYNWNTVVVGVVNDYHQVSLKKPLEPTVFFCTIYDGEYYSVRLETDRLAETVDGVRNAWEKAFPGNPFEYFFLDDYFNQQYENERKFGRLFGTFATLAVIVGCLGLFGLSAYTANQRTKEIGIRKVLGSTAAGIFVLLSKEYLKLIGISIIIATPLVWVLMGKWVESFPYRTDVSWWIFAVAGAGVMVVSLGTVSYQTWQAARVNPAQSLRSE